MQTRTLGRNGPQVSAAGLGLLGMTRTSGSPEIEDESVATIEAALEAGVTMLDTGDFYGNGHNELLLARALKAGNREKAFIAVKFGVMRDPSGQFLGFDGRPQAVKNFLHYSLKRLGIEHVDLYMPARPDPQVPIEDTIGAISELVEAGYVRHVGLSEAPEDIVRRAHAVHPIAALQTEYSIVSRGIEETMLPMLRELGIATVAYGIVAHGLVDNPAKLDALRDPSHPLQRFGSPRVQGENLEANRMVVERLAAIAAKQGMTVGQLAFAWVLSRGDDIIPLIGTRRRDRLSEMLAVVDKRLDAETMARIESEISVNALVGDRFSPAMRAALDRVEKSAQ